MPSKTKLAMGCEWIWSSGTTAGIAMNGSGRAIARKAGERSVCGKDTREPHLQARSRTPLRPQPESIQRDPPRLPDPNQKKDIWRPLKSHR